MPLQQYPGHNVFLFPHFINGINKMIVFPNYINVNMNISTPCRATIRLAIQSGTLVPAARKVMPMMTSGIPRVKLIMVT